MRNISLLYFLLYIVALNSNAQNSKAYYKFPTEANIIYDICFTNNGGAIGIADNKSIKVYSTKSKELIRDFKDGHTGQIHSIDISKDSTILVRGSKDSTVVIWNFIDGTLLKKLKYNGIVTSVCLSPNSQYLAYGGSDNKVFLFDIKNSKLISTYTEHTDDITSICFSPDGKYIATSAMDKLIQIYKSDSLIKTLPDQKNCVRDISINSVGTKLISCGDNGKTYTWDISNINNTRIINESKRGFNWLLSVDFNEDDKTYAIADFNGNAEIVGQFGSYKTNVKAPINKIMFKPKEGIFLKIAIATRGKGVLLIDAKDMKLRH